MGAEVYAEIARIFYDGGAWERNFRRYETLLSAGVSEEEALAIVTDVAAQQRVVQDNQKAAA